MKKLISVLIACFLAVSASAATIYVDANATGDNDGSSWTNAYNFLQDALADANSNPDINQIHVAQGIYKPTYDYGLGIGDRGKHFRMINNITLYGGFPSGGSTLQNRDPKIYETILSGDIGIQSDAYDNCYHVLYHPEGLRLNSTAILNGFTITAGNANHDSQPHYYGGGMYNYSCNPTVTNCTFSSNKTDYVAGGMYNYYSNPNITNCIFSSNSAQSGGGMYNGKSEPNITDCNFSNNQAYYHGSGIANGSNSNPNITNCTFTDNSAGDTGGGVMNHNSNPNITNCTFSDNLAGDSGGGMYNTYYSDPNISNCTFSSNSAESGGGMCNNWISGPNITNCIFSNNQADYGGGMCNYGRYGYCNPIVTNCTFSDNSAREGGGMHNNYSYPDIINCTFSNNSAEITGGGMDNFYSYPNITNCTFSNNSVETAGGGMNNWHSNTNIFNCTFSGNSASTDGGGMLNSSSSSATVTNCILWGNTASDGNEIALFSSSTIDVNYCDVKGGQAGIYNDGSGTINWGTGNIDADPLFVDANNPDPNLRDYHLQPGSPCINAGDPSYVAGPNETDLDGLPRVIGGRIDMGAYEVVLWLIEARVKFTPQALNPKSKGKWLKAHIVLPEGFSVEDVDTNEPVVAQIAELEIDASHVEVFVNEDGFVEIEAAFSRSAFCGAGIDYGPADVVVIGKLISGEDFYGTDTIRIISGNLKYLAILASHWLETGCGAPDWCGGVDVDQNTVVDFVDFTLSDSCCIEVPEE